jgi:hypothetical protein
MEKHMKDFLQDLVAHTHSLGFLPLLKVIADDKETLIESTAEDRSVILNAKTKDPVEGLEGTFGMPDLNKLDIHLKCPEYKENFEISVIVQQRNGEDIPTGLHFKNGTGDFTNDYRFMNSDIISEKMKSVKFKGAKWDIEFSPTMASIQKLKFQAVATDEPTFQITTENNNLMFSFGDASTHAGRFIFQEGVSGNLKQTWSWGISSVQSILNLNGDKTMRISDVGALQITVDSGIAVYEYILPAQSK